MCPTRRRRRSTATAAARAAYTADAAGPVPAADVYVPAPTSPEPEGIPQTVPVAPRGSAPDATAATVGGRHGRRACWIPSRVPDLRASCRPFPVCWPGRRPRLPVGPARLGAGLAAGRADDCRPGLAARRPAPAGDEANYYFLTAPPCRRIRRIAARSCPTTTRSSTSPTLRADFPILRETVNGKPLIWFDNAATTQKPQAVIDRLSYFYAHENSNIHRAAHELAARATDAYEEARDTVRRFIGASKSEEIIFVRGTTEAINLVAYAWGGKHLGPGDEIVITHLEHHANIVPWQLLSQQTGAVLRVAPVDDAGNLLMREFEDLLGPEDQTGCRHPCLECARAR